jgi:hypothetical protein
MFGLPPPRHISTLPITSFRAGDVDFGFTLDTGRFSASQRTVETGHKQTSVSL